MEATCTDCGRPFRSDRGLAQHKRRFCRATQIESESSLLPHRTATQEELESIVTTFSCSSCSRSFSSASGLAQHQRRAHAEEYHASHEPASRTAARWDKEEITIIARKEIAI
jgi:hypothetical protein